MTGGKLSKEAIFEGNSKWEQCITREVALYKRPNDIRTPFNRDYNRILHCNAYRRLKHKTQVFFNTQNDHICTRIEHVQHVASIAYSIGDYLGLNTELTLAIATGHDIGHAPFGHEGESVLSEIRKKEFNDGEGFWHEKNSLFFADRIELLESPNRENYNLDLTYAVRDGIISHCGEVDEQAIKPREDAIDLYTIRRANRPNPYTWEGCVVKIADKIAYLGRDIEDAMALEILSRKQLRELINITKGSIDEKNVYNINNTVLIHKFITSLCSSSNLEEGIYFTKEDFQMLNEIKDFNYQYIYNHPRLQYFKKYVHLIIHSLYQVLVDANYLRNGLKGIEEMQKIYPKLGTYFLEWIKKYSNYDKMEEKSFPEAKRFRNYKIYELAKEEDYKKAALDFIAGMTDDFAIKVFEEITAF